MQDILHAYDLEGATITPVGSGLINTTWKVSNGQDFILQRVNDAVFTKPEAIGHNIRLLSAYLAQHDPGYYFTSPVKTTAGADLLFLPGQGWFRLFRFVPGSHSVDVVTSTKQAFEAAKQFGKFTRLLAAFDAAQLQQTIPDFHNLTLRYEQFQQALQEGDKERLANAGASIKQLQEHQAIADQYEVLKKSPHFKVRVTHHDTKISNVLFDDTDNGLCVIDLDTVMPGYFISDVGDMMRTYLSPVSEEEKDLAKIAVRNDYFRAIVSGYLREMQTELTAMETGLFVYAGKFMLYMQALRFLTDYLNRDRYYGRKYEDQNLVRANNQIVLLQQLEVKESQLQQLVQQLLAAS
jgi:Ser/Thr protein kinase RdoA (MazF antagonist)